LIKLIFLDMECTALYANSSVNRQTRRVCNHRRLRQADGSNRHTDNQHLIRTDGNDLTVL